LIGLFRPDTAGRVEDSGNACSASFLFSRPGRRAEAREQVRHGAAQWLTGDRTAALGRQMVLSITRYRQANRRSPTWAEALAGVDPSLGEPLTTVPESWPLAPAVWRRRSAHLRSPGCAKTTYLILAGTSLAPQNMGSS
jgi:hypothetical protein